MSDWSSFKDEKEITDLWRSFLNEEISEEELDEGLFSGAGKMFSNYSGYLKDLGASVSGKGRTVIEIKGLPANNIWCKGLAKDLKKKIGVGGTYKNEFIEVHGENYEQVAKFLESKKISFKKIGG